MTSRLCTLLACFAIAHPAFAQAPAPAPIPTTPAPAPAPGPVMTPTQPPGQPVAPQDSAQPAPAQDPAQPAPVSPEVQAAKLHFENGVVLFNEGNFPSALAEFEQAYKIHPSAGILNNIGLVQKQLFRYGEAIESLQRYLVDSPSLPPERRAEVQQIIDDIKELLADVTFKIAPAGATIRIDGRDMGVAPLAKPLGLASGTHTVEITADGFQQQKRELMVSAKMPLTVEIALKEIPKTGKVRITASISRATIIVDGRTIGIAPVELELSAGGHTLEATASKFQPHREELVIAAGQTRDVSVSLDKVVVHKSWYTRWYVWAPVAAVVVGTTAFGLAGGFTSTQGPIDGTLAPGAGGVQ